MKKAIIAIALFAPALCLAAGTSTTTANAETKTSHHSTMKEITLTGGTELNRVEIETAAKTAGAQQASFDPTTGILKFHATKKYNEKTFVSSLEKTVPGVALKVETPKVETKTEPAKK